MKSFGLVKNPLNIDLPYTRTGLLSYSQTEHTYTMAKAARVAFGHSMATTPVHLAMAYAALANGGKLMQPRLVSEVTDAKGNVVKLNQPQMVRQVISSAVSAQMSDMLCDVVEKGTGKTAAIRGYRSCREDRHCEEIQGWQIHSIIHRISACKPAG